MHRAPVLHHLSSSAFLPGPLPHFPLAPPPAPDATSSEKLSTRSPHNHFLPLTDLVDRADKSHLPQVSLSSGSSSSMGCTASKQGRRDQRRSIAALSRCHTTPVHHPAQWKGDTCHLVSLTSSTLGSLDDRSFWVSQIRDDEDEEEDDRENKTICHRKSADFLTDRRPRTPTETPRREPEVINITELMSGLENTSPICRYPVEKSLSFKSLPELRDQTMKTWMTVDKTSSLEESERFDHGSTVRSRIMAFQEKINAERARAKVKSQTQDWGKGKVIFYFTSLRGVRKTFEDCCSVREILRGYSVRVDERDASLHKGFKEELASMSQSYKLPKVFANGRFLGGAEEIQLLHDEGELGEALKGCESEMKGKYGSCEGCGGVRFVPCHYCSGSCKIYVEEGDNGGFRRCPGCNENGLVRCPVCRIG